MYSREKGIKAIELHIKQYDHMCQTYTIDRMAKPRESNLDFGVTCGQGSSEMPLLIKRCRQGLQ